MGGGSEPLAVELADLEAGNTPERNYLTIGEHVAVYGGAVYAYSQSKYDHSDPGPSTNITECYYPIISYSHPFMLGLAKLEEEYGDTENVPEDVPFPELNSFKVIVKAKHFDTVGDIPDGIASEESLEGLLVNRIESLSSDEKQLIASSFPQADLDNIMIIQAGRKPASLLKSLGMISGGVFLAVAGLAWMFLGGRD